MKEWGGDGILLLYNNEYRGLNVSSPSPSCSPGLEQSVVGSTGAVPAIKVKPPLYLHRKMAAGK